MITLIKRAALHSIPPLLIACTATQPKNTTNICAIFREKGDWYRDTENSRKKWGVPIHVQMAIMQQESNFIADAQPPRPYLLGIIPWFRSSSAYGYAQAQDTTWDWYTSNTGVWIAERDDFTDAIDFIGWYGNMSHKLLKISKWDAKRQYLAYHEGHSGYKRKSYLKKPRLLTTAQKVKKHAQQYNTQLKRCQHEFTAANSWFW